MRREFPVLANAGAEITLHLKSMPKTFGLAKKAPKRTDMAGVMERFPRTISLMARGATPIAHFFEQVPGKKVISNYGITK